MAEHLSHLQPLWSQQHWSDVPFLPQASSLELLVVFRPLGVVVLSLDLTPNFSFPLRVLCINIAEFV